MAVRVATLALIALAGLSACAKTDAGAKVTLYRNSSLDPRLRIHFGTFDAAESNPNYNMANCQMAARLLNANLRKLNDGDQPVGFWCEDGPFTQDGQRPTSFDAAFPTDT